jgi:hypothetical protein
LAAALPDCRQRCEQRTTVATLTPNKAAVSRQLRPAATDVASRSRRSFE